MTKVILSNEENVSYIHVYDHANFAEKGKDIVCAAISTLIFGFMNCLNKRNLKYNVFEKEADLIIRYDKLKSNEYEYYEKFLYYSLKMIEESYPKNIKVDLKK